MEMEDHQHHHHQQYGMSTDLRQLINGVRSAHFPSIPSSNELFSGHRNLSSMVSSNNNNNNNNIPHHQNNHYDMMMMLPRGLVTLDDYAAITPLPSTAAPVTTTTTTTSGSTPDTAGCIGGDASTGRWPRQETLTLLEIRSRLDPKFKEANQKAPLWDELSRIMSEEHGYQRSGKKCREKFENLYKYYKKTKEGKAGRHDGKHYRFFRQLEALYGGGENSNNNNNNNNNQTIPETTNTLVTNFHNFQTSASQYHNNHSLSNSTNFDTSSSDAAADDDDSMENRMRKRKSGKRSWKVKIKDFIDSQMKKLVEKQEEWLEKLVKTIEDKEKERMLREEEWRKQEANRLEREHRFWAKERAWIEARDAALMDALHNISGREVIKAEDAADEGVMAADFQNQNVDADSWQESEVRLLQQLRNEYSEEVRWEEVANKMACFGYERNALMCKKKWESISKSKKHKENSSRTCFYFNNNDHDQSSMYNSQGSGYCDVNDQRHEDIGKIQLRYDDGSSPSNSNVGNVATTSDTCFPFLMNEGGNLWENFGLKINKSNQNH